jgi:hypothetical protein
MLSEKTRKTIEKKADCQEDDETIQEKHLPETSFVIGCSIVCWPTDGDCPIARLLLSVYDFKQQI